MSAATPPAGGQTPPADPSQGQTPPTSGQTPATPHTPSEGDDQPMTVAEARRLRDELKSRRESEAAAKADLKKLQDAQLSEIDRERKARVELESQHADAQRRLQELRVEQAVERLARSAEYGIEDIEAAVKLIDWSQLTFDKDTGQPTNAKEVLKALVKDHPFLKGQNPANPTISPTNPGSSPGQPFFTKAQIQDIKFYEQNKAAIKLAFLEGRYEK